MNDNSGEGPGQHADSSAAQPSAPPLGSEPAQASTPEEPDEETHKGDQPENPEATREDEKEEGHENPDDGASKTDDEEGRKAFDRVAEVLMQDEVITEEAQATMEKAITEIRDKWPEQLDRTINDYRDTALHMAAYKDLPRAFNALLKARESLKNTTNEGGSTPLHVSCYKDRRDFVERLVDAEADINAPDTESMTPLNVACTYGHTEIVRFLLSHHVDFTLADDDGWTPFITAVANGHKSVAELLLAGGRDIDVNHADNPGMTPLHHAACGSDPLELVPFLIGKKADISKKDNCGSTPLDLACFNGNEDGVCSLLTNTKDRKTIESRTNYGSTPLITASLAGSPKIVKLLLKAGAERTSCTTDDHGRWTALMTACRRGQEEIVRMLLDPCDQADVLLNQEDIDGDTPIHYACLYGQRHIVEILLNSEVEHSKKNKNGDTPLHHASRYGYSQVVDILLESKADHSKQNGDGLTPLHMACHYDFEDAKREDEESQPESCETASQSGATDERAEAWFRTAESLLKYGADPLIRTKQGNSALHVVAKKRDSAWISKIMETPEPKDFSTKNEHNQTALQIAVERKDSSVILALLKKLGSAEYDFANREKDAYKEALEAFDIDPIYETLLDFFMAAKPQDSRKAREKWSLLEWAAVEVHPKLLWKVFIKSAGISHINNRIKVAVKELEDRTKPEDPSRNIGKERDKKNPKGVKKNAEVRAPAEGKSNRKQHTEKPPKGRDGKGDEAEERDRKLVMEILMNPPITTTSRPPAVLSLREKPPDPRVPRGMEAVVLDFFVNDHGSGFLRRTEKVEEVIYGRKGPRGIMSDLKKHLQEMKEESKLPVGQFQKEILEEQSEPKFTWIHLPANNMRLMNDLTTRVWLDKTKRKDAKATDENPGSSDQPLEHMRDETADATSGRPEPQVEGGNDVISRGTQTKGEDVNSKGTQTEGDEQKRGDDGRNHLEVEEAVRAKYDTARWFFERSWRQLPENPSEKRFMRPTCKLLRDRAGASNPGDLTALYMPYLKFATEVKPDKAITAYKPGRKEAGRPQIEINPEKPDAGDKPGGKEGARLQNEAGPDKTDAADKPSGKEADCLQKKIDPNKTGAGEKPGVTEADHLQKFRDARTNHKRFLETHSKDIVHGSRTLDEFYYQHLVKSGKGHETPDESREEHLEAENKPGKGEQEAENRRKKQNKFAEDMKERNQNQVTSRYFYGDGIANGGHWDILRVDQLWMWIIDDKTIVTSSTHSFDGTRDPVMDGVLEYLSKQTEDPRPQGEASKINIQKLSRVIVQVCCNFYDEAWRDSAGRTESVRHIFANTINEIAIGETDLFQKYQKVAKTTADAKASDAAKAKLRQSRLDKMEADIVMSSKLFYEIKDASDELKILLELATRQKEVQAEMCGGEAMGDCKAGNIVDDLVEKISLASKIRGAVQTTLSLQQSELSILQNELSIEQNKAAQRQGKTLMTFTIFTILFLPASFLSSLFALDFASFLDTPGWAFIPIGAAFLVMAVFIAWLYRASLAEELGEWAKKLSKWATELREWVKELREWTKERQWSQNAFVRSPAKMLLRAVPEEKSSSKDGAASENDGQKKQSPSKDGASAENEGQKKNAPSKDGAAAENEAGGGSGAEAKPPGDDRQRVAEADIPVVQEKTPAQSMMTSVNGANGQAVPNAEPRRRSWIKRLFRGDQVSDRGPEA